MPSQVVTLDSLSWHDLPPHGFFTLEVPDALTRGCTFRNTEKPTMTLEQRALCVGARV